MRKIDGERTGILLPAVGGCWLLAGLKHSSLSSLLSLTSPPIFQPNPLHMYASINTFSNDICHNPLPVKKPYKYTLPQPSLVKSVSLHFPPSYLPYPPTTIHALSLQHTSPHIHNLATLSPQPPNTSPKTTHASANPPSRETTTALHRHSPNLRPTLVHLPPPPPLPPARSTLDHLSIATHRHLAVPGLLALDRRDGFRIVSERDGRMGSSIYVAMADVGDGEAALIHSRERAGN